MVTGPAWAEDRGTSMERTTALGAGRTAAWVVGSKFVPCVQYEIEEFSFFFFGGEGVAGGVSFFIVWHNLTTSKPTCSIPWLEIPSNPSIWYLIYLQLLACFGGLNWPEISRNARSQLVMHLEVSVFGGGRIILQCLVDVQNHFRPLLTKVVFKHSDVTHMCVYIYIYQI